MRRASVRPHLTCAVAPIGIGSSSIARPSLTRAGLVLFVCQLAGTLWTGCGVRNPSLPTDADGRADESVARTGALGHLGIVRLVSLCAFCPVDDADVRRDLPHRSCCSPTAVLIAQGPLVGALISVALSVADDLHLADLRSYITLKALDCALGGPLSHR